MADSWRWQLRDSEGQWVKMGSKVKWLTSGTWRHGEVVGSPRPNVATIKPDGGGPSQLVDARRITVEGTAIPPQPKPDAGIGRPTRTAKAKVEIPAAAKTPKPVLTSKALTWYPAKGQFGQPAIKAEGTNGTFMIDGGGAGRMKWTVVYPDGDYGMTPTRAEAVEWADLQEAEDKTKTAKVEIPAAAKTPRTLTTKTANRTSTSSGLDATTRRWEWDLGGDRTALLVHTRPASRSRRPLWSATITDWPKGADEPALEKFGPEVSTQTRALEWLNATLTDLSPTPSSQGTMEVAKGATTVRTPRLSIRTLDVEAIPNEDGKGFQGAVINNVTGEQMSRCDHRHANRLTATECAKKQRTAILFPAVKATERTAADGIEILSVTPDTSGDYPRVKVTPYRDGDLQVESFWLNGMSMVPAGHLIKKDGTLGPLREQGAAKAPPEVVAAFRSLAADPQSGSHGTMGAKTEGDIVKVKDAQPAAKSPKADAAAKKALAVKTDTRLAEIYEARLILNIDQERLAYDIQRSSGSVNNKPRYSSGPAQWDRSLDEAMTDFKGQTWDRDAWERSVTKYQANQAQIDTLNAETAQLGAIYTEAGGWTRAFLVTNAGGHVHRSMSCSTCYPTTRFHWLPEYSGSDEDQIVGDAGERACTVCYPSAPVNVLNRPTKIFSEDEKTAAAARVERAAAKTARDAATAAKAITNPDGTALWVMDAYDIDRLKQPRTRYSPRRFGEELKTEMAARQWYVRHEADLLVKQAHPEYGYGSRHNPEAQEQILFALAAKHPGTTLEEFRAELAAKAKAKANKILREMGQPKIP